MEKKQEPHPGWKTWHIISQTSGSLPWVPTTPSWRHKSFRQLHRWLSLPPSWRLVLLYTLLLSRPETLKAVSLLLLTLILLAKVKEGKDVIKPLLREAIPLSLFYILPNESWDETSFYQAKSKNPDANFGTQTQLKLFEVMDLTDHTSTPTSQWILHECLKFWFFSFSFLKNYS